MDTRESDGASAAAPVLLIGSTGFIGRRIFDTLERHGVAVRRLIRPRSAARLGVAGNDAVIVGDLDDADALRRAVTGARAVVYAAGSVRGVRAEDFAAANVDGVARLAAAIEVHAPATPALLLSSLAAERPDLSLYAHSKRLGEDALKAHDVIWTILRPPAVYGPGDVEMRPLLGLLRRGIALRPGPAGQRIALLHVDDLAAAVWAWLGSGTECRKATYAIDDGFNDAGRPGYDWPALAALLGPKRLELGVPAPLLNLLGALNGALARVFGYAPMLTSGKARELQHACWVCDNSAFARATGWRPQIGLRDGVEGIFGVQRGAAG